MYNVTTALEVLIMLPDKLQNSPTRKRQIGPADTEQIRLLLRVSPAQRLQTMLDMQAVMLNTWQARLRHKYPHLTDLELCRLMFERLADHA